MSWILLSMLAALGFAFVNVIDKYIMAKVTKDPLVPALLLGFYNLVFVGVIALVHGIRLPGSLIWLGLLTGVAWFGLNICYFQAMKQEQVSRLVPLFYLSNVFLVFFAALFLGEVFSFGTYLGIALLVLGAVLVSSDRLRLPKQRAFWWMVLASFLVALMLLITKYLLRFSDVWSLLALTWIGAFLVTLPLAILIRRSLRRSLAVGRGIWRKVFLSDIVDVLALGLLYAATAAGPVTLVAAIGAIQPFFVVLIVVLINRLFRNGVYEKLHLGLWVRRTVAIAVMFIGVLLVTL